jgi:hypothetical protein
MTQYAIKKSGTSEVAGFAIGDGDSAPAVEGFDVEAMITPATGWPAAPFEGAALIVTAGVLGWRDDRTIEDARAAAIIAVDREADTSRASVVGDPVRVKEYERAQQQAEAFRDAGFTGAAPSCVGCWATAKEWTAQQAAEDILAASARWLGALDGIRALRLQAKEDIRRATSNTQVDTLLATFTATLTAAMQGVQ